PGGVLGLGQLAGEQVPLVGEGDGHEAVADRRQLGDRRGAQGVDLGVARRRVAGRDADGRLEPGHDPPAPRHRRGRPHVVGDRRGGGGGAGRPGGAGGGGGGGGGGGRGGSARTGGSARARGPCRRGPGRGGAR